MIFSEIKIVNVVVSTKVGDEVDLYKIADVLSNVDYEPEQFPGLICRLSEPKVALVFFGNGKLNCTGAKSKEEAEFAIRKVMGYLKEAGFELYGNPKIEIQNIVVTADLEVELNLDELATLENSEYEPEQFPGLVYKINNPKVTVLFFGSGKIVITGLKNENDVNRVLEIIKDVLKESGE